jgi:predicted TIM-barrel fold metal-dependent hydrolase
MTAEIARLGVADGPHQAVNELVAQTRLIDHHTHSIVRGTVAPSRFVFMVSESDRPAAAEATGLDSQIGVAIRRWCAPLLGLPAHASAEDYLAHRSTLENEDVAGRLLPVAGFERMLIDTGFRGDELLDGEELRGLAAAPIETIVRLEGLAERVALSGVKASAFADAFREALEAELATAVGLKSIIAYRAGLDVDPTAPTAAEVVEQAGAWLREIEATGVARLVDPVLLRFVLWEGARTGRPLQIHTGYGDPDLDLHRSDPLLLTDFLRATERTCPVLLLHTYPFQRNAGYLAQMFPHVFMDVGLAVNYVGAQSSQVIAESLEVAPFTKVLFSSDAWGVPELHLLGSWLFRRGLARVLGAWVARDDWSLPDAERVVELVATENARRVYGLDAAT